MFLLVDDDDDFDLLSLPCLLASPDKFLITGDFNIHLANMI